MKTPRTRSGRASNGAPPDGAKPPTTPRRTKSKPPPAGQVTTPTERASIDVAQLAHQLFVSRGGVHGHDLDDWLEAERQIRAVRAAPTGRASVAADASHLPADLRS